MWHSGFEERKKYTGRRREPFFELARPYIKGVVLDIGGGDGHFFTYLDIEKRPNTYLLEGNPITVKLLGDKGMAARQYRIPEKIPFGDESVGLIHLSHVVEHLHAQELYDLLKEVNRVLEVGGVVIISTPLLYEKFYDDMSHVKPYTPQVFINYLCHGEERTRAVLSASYRVESLTYRWGAVERSFFSKYAPIDLLLHTGHVLSSFIGFRRLQRTGYTIILKKHKE